MADESKIVKVLDSIEEAIESASEALETLNQKALKGGLGFDTLVKSMETSVKVLDNLTRSVGEFGSALTFGLDFGVISGGMSELADLFSMVLGSATKLIGIFDGVGKGIDAVTGFSRSLNASLFESVAKFNGSFASAKRFSEYIIQSAQKFATAEFGFISPADRIEAVKSLEQAGIPLGKMSDIIQSTAGSMDLLNTAFLQSGALGLDLSSYMDMLSDAIMRQGLSSQEAVEQLALFGDISEETGLRVEKVARSLQGLSGRFSKLGITANFGKPILQGFTSSLSSMGLGIENAIDLSENLSNTLVKLTSDYAAAYITFQRGGLDINGGALGAGISLRADLLKAQQTGNQGDIAKELAGAVKDTLASFTGGQIITVQQAAENPALQQTFFTQTQLLKNLYGIAEAADQDRTLELLQQIDESTQNGDKELTQSLGEDLQNILQGRNETLGYQEKTAKFTEATFAELHTLNANVIEAFRLSGDNLSKTIADFQRDALKSDQTQELIRDLNAQSPEEMKFDFSAALQSLKSTTENGLSRLSNDLGSLDIGDSVVDALSGMTLNVNNPGGDVLLQNLKSSIDGLTQKIGEYLARREDSKLFGP